jgi:hypothetical protein
MTSDMTKIIREKTEDLNDKVKQRKGYELAPMTTVDIARKFDPRKKWDRVSAYEQGQVVGRDKSYYLVQHGSQTYKVPRWQLTQS